jgi:hypothetical protein
VIYLFGGISKLRGDMWWDGSAVWFALANAEYQSLDLTWLARFRWAIALALGMPTFGLAMIIANLAFVSPDLVDTLARYCFGARGSDVQAEDGAAVVPVTPPQAKPRLRERKLRPAAR